MKTKIISGKKYTLYAETSTMGLAKRIASDLKARNIAIRGKSRKTTMSTRILAQNGGYIVYYKQK